MSLPMDPGHLSTHKHNTHKGFNTYPKQNLHMQPKSSTNIVLIQPSHKSCQNKSIKLSRFA